MKMAAVQGFTGDGAEIADGIAGGDIGAYGNDRRICHAAVARRAAAVIDGNDIAVKRVFCHGTDDAVFNGMDGSAFVRRNINAAMCPPVRGRFRIQQIAETEWFDDHASVNGIGINIA